MNVCRERDIHVYLYIYIYTYIYIYIHNIYIYIYIPRGSSSSPLGVRGATCLRRTNNKEHNINNGNNNISHL